MEHGDASEFEFCGLSLTYNINDGTGESFVEKCRQRQDGRNTTERSMVEALCIFVEPKECCSVVKELSKYLPLEQQLLHLKRVKKYEEKASTEFSVATTPPTKRPKMMLQVLLGTASSGNFSSLSTPVLVSNTNNRDGSQQQNQQENTSENVLSFLSTYLPFHTVMVPRYAPQSKEEWEKSNSIWPTHYYPLQTVEYHRQRQALLPREVETMKDHIINAMKHKIVRIVDPTTNSVISESEGEQCEREKVHTHGPFISNCLATPILLAIQGVSRMERRHLLLDQAPHQDPCPTSIATPAAPLLDRDGRVHQYLCTGYDMYCYYEPTVFEAMACLHSRLRRLIFCSLQAPQEQPRDAVWLHGCSKHFVHDLPGTNHRYRVFKYHPGK